MLNYKRRTESCQDKLGRITILLHTYDDEIENLTGSRTKSAIKKKYHRPAENVPGKRTFTFSTTRKN